MRTRLDPRSELRAPRQRMRCRRRHQVLEQAQEPLRLLGLVQQSTLLHVTELSTLAFGALAGFISLIFSYRTLPEASRGWLVLS